MNTKKYKNMDQIIRLNYFLDKLKAIQDLYKSGKIDQIEANVLIQEMKKKYLL